MNREELALETEHLDLLDALAAAKEAHRTKPTDKTKAALDDAKAAIGAFRLKWRTVREAFKPPPGPGDGVATPATVKGKLQVK